MRLNRVLALLALAIATGIALIWVEGQNLRLEQKLAELHRQRELLIEEQARLRLDISRLTAPAQVIDSVKTADKPLAPRSPQHNLQQHLQR